MAPLFTENQVVSLEKSGKMITWKNNKFEDVKEDENILNPELQDRLWKTSLELCADEKTVQISKSLSN